MGSDFNLDAVQGAADAQEYFAQSLNKTWAFEGGICQRIGEFCLVHFALFPFVFFLR